jgi:predicted HAD superfamily Cof-like phosphohydrolase
MSIEKMLTEFHDKYGHYIPKEPTLNVPSEVTFLRYRLIKEEVQETFDAMGIVRINDHEIQLHPKNQNIVEIADGIADSLYVLVGTAISYGIPIERIFTEVHRSNMTKTNIKAIDGQKYGTKTPKGPDYIPPDIEGILSRPDELTKLEKKYYDDEVDPRIRAILSTQQRESNESSETPNDQD